MAKGAQNGFTLIEMAVVIIIIGLIVGGILGGQSLIRSAEIRSVMVDIEKFNSAIASFKQRYEQLPGDMDNAVEEWGANGANPDDLALCAIAWAARTSTTSTCNGNGDGRIAGFQSTTGHQREHILVWKHLTNAGLLEGSYTGQCETGSAEYIAGINVPTTAAGENAGFSIFDAHEWWWPDGANWVFPWGNSDHVYLLGAWASDDRFLAPLFTVEEARNIDLKIDDGKPGTGIVKTPRGGMNAASQWAPLCADSNDPVAANYNVAQTGTICSLFFDASF